MKNATENKVVYEDTPADIAESLDFADQNNRFVSLDEILARSKKQRITLNVDSDILAAFRSYAKSHGAKYQTLMNEALRGTVEKQFIGK